jgi:hypothetical protein
VKEFLVNTQGITKLAGSLRFKTYKEHATTVGTPDGVTGMCTFDWAGEASSDVDYIAGDIAGYKFARTY